MRATLFQLNAYASLTMAGNLNIHLSSEQPLCMQRPTKECASEASTLLVRFIIFHFYNFHISDSRISQHTTPIHSRTVSRLLRSKMIKQKIFSTVYSTSSYQKRHHPLKNQLRYKRVLQRLVLHLAQLAHSLAHDSMSVEGPQCIT